MLIQLFSLVVYGGFVECSASPDEACSGLCNKGMQMAAACVTQSCRLRCCVCPVVHDDSTPDHSWAFVPDWQR